MKLAFFVHLFLTAVFVLQGEVFRSKGLEGEPLIYRSTLFRLLLLVGSIIWLPLSIWIAISDWRILVFSIACYVVLGNWLIMPAVYRLLGSITVLFGKRKEGKKRA